jgi:hypothetical protein
MIRLWSGYRDAQTLRVLATENCAEDLFFGSEPAAEEAISIGDIANACLFDPDVFDRFGGEAGEAEQDEPDAAEVSDQPTPPASPRQ